MENVTLRTGTQVTIAAATAALLSIDDYLDCNEPFAFHELVMVARDPSYVPYGDMGSRMNRLGLVDAAGTMHDITRAVVLASADGEGPQLQRVSPV